MDKKLLENELNIFPLLALFAEKNLLPVPFFIKSIALVNALIILMKEELLLAARFVISSLQLGRNFQTKNIARERAVLLG
jgi:hypothetical protein